MIGARELRADLARHLRRAAAGERVEVAVHGRPAVAARPARRRRPHHVEALIAAGALVPPRRTSASRRPPAPIPVWTGVRLDRLLRELRG